MKNNIQKHVSTYSAQPKGMFPKWTHMWNQQTVQAIAYPQHPKSCIHALTCIPSTPSGITCILIIALMNFACFWILYKWSHTICTLSWLTSFTHLSAYEINVYYSYSWFFCFSIYSIALFYSMNILQFIYSLYSKWIVMTHTVLSIIDLSLVNLGIHFY